MIAMCDPLGVSKGSQVPGMVLLEFDSPKRASEWYKSPQYQAILSLRLRASSSRTMCLTGAPL